jgi:hypothetical protein
MASGQISGTSITGISPTGGTNLDQFIASLANLTGGQGQNTFTQGQNTAAPGLQLLTQLAKGDQGDLTQAAQPEIDSITQQFDQIRNMISQQPRGGGKTTALAEAPFQKAGDIQRTEGSMRAGSAGQLAGIGLQQEGIGTSLEGESAGIGLQKQQLDYGQQAALMNMLGGLGQGVGSVIGGALASSGGS